MSTRTVERPLQWVFRGLLLLGVLQRAYVLHEFGFQYIGIDDALIQQVAIDYGQGIFREPYLYGQNYNPMLEALLAAPFVRMGAAPWIVLPIITSLLALLPFWSIALWCQRNALRSAALVFAAMPLFLPTEWGLITTMPRGFVHGIALLGIVPWTMHLRRPWLKHGSTSLLVGAAVLCNPNAFPVAFGIGAWSILHNYRKSAFWIHGPIGLLPVATYYFLGQRYFKKNPGHLVHELSPSDLGFESRLLKEGALHVNDHLLHMTPFPAAAGILAPLIVMAAAVLAWRHGSKVGALALGGALVIYAAALGIVKVHEGCSSVFFPLSRMFLAMPILLAAALALLMNSIQFRPGSALLLLLGAGLSVGLNTLRLKGTVQYELASQSCGYVREEPLSVIRARCEATQAAAMAYHAAVIAPIRWPGIRVDHADHFVAHFTCYACPQLVGEFPPVVGIGFDRRSWVREEYTNSSPGRVLFLGGDPQAWRRAMHEPQGIHAAAHAGLEFHALECDTATTEALILELGIDDDLKR
ncbi:MAG: hypothetical protein JNL43_04565 [Flavobacteriales bacterium]|nr:hypothetical protein [Flavobacteriales bacterium]